MYPQVFSEFQDFKKKYGDVSVLPTLAYFHGLESQVKKFRLP